MLTLAIVCVVCGFVFAVVETLIESRRTMLDDKAEREWHLRHMDRVNERKS